MKVKNLFIVCVIIILISSIFIIFLIKDGTDNKSTSSNCKVPSQEIITFTRKNDDKKQKELLTLDKLSKMVGADNFWKNGYNGDGITIAVLDSGIYPHMDLTKQKNRIVGFVDLINHIDTVYDDNGHGTEIAGIIGGDGQQSNGLYKGIAPFANFVSVKVLNYECKSNIKTIVDGIRWVIKNKEKYNIKILNISIGLPTSNQEDINLLTQEAERAYQSGILVVSSVGNFKYGVNCYSPSDGENILAVGAVIDTQKRNDFKYQIADFSMFWQSNKGFSKPDLVAPGCNIVSLESDVSYRGGEITNQKIRYSDPVSGTSESSTIVTGVAALLMQKYPNKSNKMIKEMILKNCVKIKEYDYVEEGNGFIYLKEG